jgi:hypothetical protein
MDRGHIRLLLSTRGSVLGLLLIFLNGWASGADLRMTACSPTNSNGYISSLTLNSAGDSISAVQFDLEYDPMNAGIEVLWDSAQAEAEKNLSITIDVGFGRKRVIIIGLNVNPLLNGGLVIIRIHTPSESMSCLGTVSVSRVVAVAPTGDPVPVAVLVDPDSPGGRSWQVPGDHLRPLDDTSIAITEQRSQ